MTDPVLLADLAIKCVVDASPCGTIKKVYLISKILYKVCGAIYFVVKIKISGGFIGSWNNLHCK